MEWFRRLLTRPRRKKTDGIGRSPVLVQTSLFSRLQAKVQKLQKYLIFLMWLIALLTMSILFLLQVNQLRRQGRLSARYFSLLVSSQPENLSQDLSQLSHRLEEEMRRNSVVFCRLLGPGGAEIMSLGDPGPSLLAMRQTELLPRSVNPLQAIEIEVDSIPLARQAAVFGILFLAGTLLTVTI